MSGLGCRATPGWRQSTTTSVLGCIRPFFINPFVLQDMTFALFADRYHRSGILF